jgi:hypothetical protein
MLHCTLCTFRASRGTSSGSYTSDDIRQWKVEHERGVEDTLSDAVAALTFKELEQVTDTLLANPPLQNEPDLCAASESRSNCF